jgi:glycosyltransferase involved in cell wall biosynthesis
MRCLYLTAGAAEMYCGSCLRDNALAAALLARGHDVLLTPVYTPTTTDEPNVSGSRVFFGGVSVYLEQHFPMFRSSPAVFDRIWDSTAVLRLASKRQIKIDPARLGEMTVSMLRGMDGFQRKEIVKMLAWLETQPRFDVINLPFVLLIGLARPFRQRLEAPIACTLQGDDLFLENLREPWKSQSLDLIRRALDDVDVFIAVSEYYVEFMTRYLGIPRSRLRVVPIGINMSGHQPRPARRTPPYTVGYFARVAPEKGLHVLVEAYARLRARPGVPKTKLLAAGYLLNEHRAYLSGIEARVRGLGFADEFRYAGAPDRAGKIALYSEMDVFSAPATYDEPKGFTLIEAMANGIPIVQPRRGAFTEIVERAGGGLLVAPDDPEALADGLFALLTDRDRAAALGNAGAEGVRRDFTSDRMAETAERVYEELRSSSFQLRTQDPGPRTDLC